tara:strand:- start:765 stop:1001 length:237 start_codon:yes stop_codon:yes gene_type:complete
MSGLKVKELNESAVYECRLSGKRVLIVKIESQTTKDTDGKETTAPEYKAGKVCIQIDTGDMKYSLIELHDGQLTQIKS